jgi:pyruvate,water dikinase
MAAFDRMPSGIKGLDEALDSIRLGDNVVWQVSSLADFRPISDAFVRQSVADGRDAIYMRFASYPRLVARDTPGVGEVRLDPRKGFETFTMQVHDAIEREGREAFYVFDSLSGRAGPGRGCASSWGSARRPWTARGATTPGS